MLSICIPVYNQDIRKLVFDLQKQASLLSISYEIRIIDDCSPLIEIRNKNKEVESLSNVKYSELSHNIGRSAIRNLLAQEATYQSILFIDCDAEVFDSQFLANYLPFCKPQVVCSGGCTYAPKPTEKEYVLRWTFGVHREKFKACKKDSSFHKFTTFNILIDRDIIINTPFDESLKTYGHEDTLLGVELKQKNINIQYIDNPLIHTGLDSAEVFLQKTKDSIANLILIEKNREDYSDLRKHVRLLSTYYTLKEKRLTPIILRLFKLLHPFIELNLKSKKPRLLLLDVYKIGYICLLKEEEPH